MTSKLPIRIVNAEWGKHDMTALPFAYRLTHLSKQKAGYLRIAIFRKAVLLTYKLRGAK